MKILALVPLTVAGSPPAAVETKLEPNGGILVSRWLGSRAADDLFAVEPSGRRTRHLTHGKGRDVHAAWSPDGCRIAFVRDHGRARTPDELWVMRRDGSEKRNLYEGTSFRGLGWSPDGSRMVFALHDQDRQQDLHVVDVSSGRAARLTNTPGEDELDPDWSPDGTRIAYAAGPRWGEEIAVYTVEPDGEARARLTGDATSFAPVWSPDGTHIAFLSSRDDQKDSDDGKFTELYVMDDGGEDETRVSNIARSWDEDHRWVTNDLLAWKARYNDRRRGRPTDTDIFVAQHDGRSRRNVTSNRGFHDGSPVPSPDGRWIALWRQKDGARTGSGLFKIRVDGSGERKLLPVDAHGIAPNPLDWAVDRERPAC